MSEEERRRASDSDGELHVEVAPLVAPPDTPRPRGPTPTRRRRLWGTLVAGGVVVLMLAIALGGIPSLRDALRDAITARVAAPTPTLTAKPALPLLGPVPTNCPPGNSVTTFAPNFPQGVAIDPTTLTVWVAGFTGPQATLLLNNTPTNYGYPAMLYLVAGQNAPNPMTISIKGVFAGTGNGMLALAESGQTEPHISVTISPNVNEHTPGGLGTWPLEVYLPSAGCYFLNVSGTSGTFFAAGSAASSMKAGSMPMSDIAGIDASDEASRLMGAVSRGLSR